MKGELGKSQPTRELKEQRLEDLLLQAAEILSNTDLSPSKVKSFLDERLSPTRSHFDADLRELSRHSDVESNGIAPDLKARLLKMDQALMPVGSPLIAFGKLHEIAEKIRALEASK